MWLGWVKAYGNMILVPAHEGSVDDKRQLSELTDSGLKICADVSERMVKMMKYKEVYECCKSNRTRIAPNRVFCTVWRSFGHFLIH